MMTNTPLMYCRNPTLDESVVVSSPNGNTNEKSEKSPRILSFTAVAGPEVKLTSTAAIQGKYDENDDVWDSGYPQPLRFVPIA